MTRLRGGGAPPRVSGTPATRTTPKASDEASTASTAAAPATEAAAKTEVATTKPTTASFTAKPTAPATQPPTASDDDGWGCQIEPADDSGLAWLVPALALLLCLRRRFADGTSHHQQRSPH